MDLKINREMLTVSESIFDGIQGNRHCQDHGLEQDDDLQIQERSCVSSRTDRAPVGYGIVGSGSNDAIHERKCRSTAIGDPRS